MDMDYYAEIESLEMTKEKLKAERVSVKARLDSAAEGSVEQQRLHVKYLDRRICSLDGRICAIDDQITMWGRRLPPSLPEVRIENLGRGQGIAISLEVTPVVATDGVEPFRIDDVVVDTACCCMMLLNPRVFDEMAAKLGLTPTKSRSALEAVDVRVHLMNDARVLRVLRRQSHDEGVSLFGMIAMDMFRLGINQSKIFHKKSTYCGYGGQRARVSDKIPKPRVEFVASEELGGRSTKDETLDYYAEIESLEMTKEKLKAERVSVKARLDSAAEGSVEQRRLDSDEIDRRICGIDKRICAIDNQITAYGYLMPSPMAAQLENLGRGQGIAISLEVTPVVATDGVEPFRIDDVVVDTACSFMMLLNPRVFDEMAAKLGLTPTKSRSALEAVDVRVHLMNDARVLRVLRRQSHDEGVSLFGLVAMEIFRLGINQSKEIFHRM